MRGKCKLITMLTCLFYMTMLNLYYTYIFNYNYAIMMDAIYEF